MSFMRRFAAAGAAAILLAAAPAAQAELTARGLWEKYRDLVTAGGGTVTVTERREGDTLVLEDLRLVTPPQKDAPRGEMRVDWVRLQERLDGTVRITLAPSAEMRFQPIEPAGAPAVRVLIEQEGALTDVREEANGDIVIRGEIARLVARSAAADGTPPPVPFTLEFGGLTQSGRLAFPDPETIVSIGSMDAASYRLDIDGTDPQSGNRVRAHHEARDVGITTNLRMPRAAMGANGQNADALALGMALEVEMRAGEGRDFHEVTEAGQGGEQTSVVEMRSKDALFGVRLRREEMAFEFGIGAPVVRVASPQLPFGEVSASAERVGFRLALPMDAVEEPGPWSFAVTLAGIMPGDMIWQMFDPSGMLPHDPATAIVETAGRLRWTRSPWGENSGAEPIPESAELRKLEIRLLGAELTGTGALTFDPSDTVTYDGMPKPEGGFDLRLSGIYGLMDKLSQMGLLPPDAVTTAGAMLGVFARPAPEGGDNLTSRIEFTADGRVLANGQPLQ